MTKHKASELAKKVKRQSITIPVQLENESVDLEFPQITKGDWEEIRLACNLHRKKLLEAGADADKAFDMWAMLLELSSGIDESLLVGKTDAEREQITKQHGMEMFKRLDHYLQVEVFYRSLLRSDPDITKDEVDQIISYGIKDMGQFISALVYFVYGAKPDEIGKKADSPLPPVEEKEAS